MTPNSIDIKCPEDENYYLWKYIDIHRLLYFLKGKLFFTRLDKLDDPIEGIKTSLLRKNQYYSKIPSNPKELNPTIPIEQRERLSNEKKLFEYLKEQEIEKSQKSQFVNCWFYGDRESMAMWNLYSNKDSVVIKVHFSEFYESLKIGFENFIRESGNRAMIVGDKISYFKLNPFERNLPKSNLKYSGLKKDVSYEHEKEYRFLISIIDKWAEEDIPSFEIPISNFNDCKFSIITHPNMEDWKFDNIRVLIQNMKLKFELKQSSIVLSKKSL